MAEINDFNAKLIEDFRANGGEPGGPFAGTPLLVLHSTGAKSGEVREHPMVFHADGDGRLVVVASKGGAPTHPAWYHNLVAHPRATVELGTETFAVDAHEAEGDERARLWTTITGRFPQFAEYQTKTDRRLPLMVLERTS